MNRTWFSDPLREVSARDAVIFAVPSILKRAGVEEATVMLLPREQSASEW
jgi:hypothetical protein